MYQQQAQISSNSLPPFWSPTPTFKDTVVFEHLWAFVVLSLCLENSLSTYPLTKLLPLLTVYSSSIYIGKIFLIGLELLYFFYPHIQICFPLYFVPISYVAIAILVSSSFMSFSPLWCKSFININRLHLGFPQTLFHFTYAKVLTDIMWF